MTAVVGVGLNSAGCGNVRSDANGITLAGVGGCRDANAYRRGRLYGVKAIDAGIVVDRLRRLAGECQNGEIDEEGAI